MSNVLIKKGVIGLIVFLVFITFISSVSLAEEITPVSDLRPDIHVDFMGVTANLTGYNIINSSGGNVSFTLTCYPACSGNDKVGTAFDFQINQDLTYGHTYSFVLNYTYLGTKASLVKKFKITTVKKILTSLKIDSSVFNNFKVGDSRKIVATSSFSDGTSFYPISSGFHCISNDSSVASCSCDSNNGCVVVGKSSGSFNLSIWEINGNGTNISNSVGLSVGKSLDSPWGFSLNQPKPLSDYYSSEQSKPNILLLTLGKKYNLTFSFQGEYSNLNCNLSIGEDNLQLKPNDDGSITYYNLQADSDLPISMTCSDGTRTLVKKYLVESKDDNTYTLKILNYKVVPNPTSDSDNRGLFNVELFVNTSVHSVCKYELLNSTEVNGFMSNHYNNLESLSNIQKTSDLDHHSYISTGVVGLNVVNVSCFSINDSSSGTLSKVNELIPFMTKLNSFSVSLSLAYLGNNNSTNYCTDKSLSCRIPLQSSNLNLNINTSEPVEYNNVYVYLNGNSLSGLSGTGSLFFLAIPPSKLNEGNNLIEVSVDVPKYGNTFRSSLSFDYYKTPLINYYLNLTANNKLLLGQTEQFSLEKCVVGSKPPSCLGVSPNEITVSYSSSGIVSVNPSDLSIAANKVGNVNVTFWYNSLNISREFFVANGLNTEGIDFYLAYPHPISSTNHTVPLSSTALNDNSLLNLKIHSSMPVTSCNQSWFSASVGHHYWNLFHLNNVYSFYKEFVLNGLNISGFWNNYYLSISCYNTTDNLEKRYKIVNSSEIPNLSVKVLGVTKKFSNEGTYITVKASTNLPSECKLVESSNTESNYKQLFDDSSQFFYTHSGIKEGEFSSDTEHTLTFYESNPGEYNYSVVCRAVKNESSYQYTLASFSFSVTKAFIHIISPSSNRVSSPNFAFKIETTEPMKDCSYSLDGGDINFFSTSNIYFFSSQITLSKKGKHVFDIKCTDNSGNFISRKFTLYYDSSPPIITYISGLAPFKDRHQSNMTNYLWLKVKAVDPESGVSYVDYYVYPGNPANYTDELYSNPNNILFHGTYPYDDKLHWLNLGGNILIYGMTYFIRARVWDFAGMSSDFNITEPVLINKSAIYDHCFDGYFQPNLGETGLDCGGSCGATCEVNQTCKINSDCISNLCNETTHVCEPSNQTVDYCSDGSKDHGETDVDCGGPCAPCSAGYKCVNDSDCVSGDICSDGTCLATKGHECSYNSDCLNNLTCSEGICLVPNNGTCSENSDCASNFCNETTSKCETPVDHCSDNKKDGDETGIDCGGSCKPCSLGVHCEVNSDCSSGYCDEDTYLCAKKETTHTIKKLPDGSSCEDDSQCESNFCNPNTWTCETKGSSSWWIWLLLIIVLLGLGAGAYIVLSKNKKKSKSSKDKTKEIRLGQNEIKQPVIKGAASPKKLVPPHNLSKDELMRIRERARINEDKKRIMSAFGGSGLSRLKQNNMINKEERKPLNSSKLSEKENPIDDLRKEVKSSPSSRDELEVELPLRLLVPSRIKGKDVWDKLDTLSKHAKVNNFEEKLNKLSSASKSKNLDEIIHKDKNLSSVGIQTGHKKTKTIKEASKKSTK